MRRESPGQLVVESRHEPDTRPGTAGADPEGGLKDAGDSLPETPTVLVESDRDATYMARLCQEVAVTRLAVRLWDLVQAKDLAGLSRFVRWQLDEDGDLGVYCYPHGEPGKPTVTRTDQRKGVITIVTAKHLPEVLSRVKPNDLRKPTLLFVSRLVDERLRGAAEPHMVWDESGDQPHLHLVPRHPLGALWLQFAEAVSGDKGYRRCAACSKWFEVSAQGARKNRVYCSEACKFEAFRERKEKGGGGGDSKDDQGRA